MNILVLGSEGFIGQTIANYFYNKGYKVYGCDLVQTTRNKYDYVQVSGGLVNIERLLQLHSMDFVINAAGTASVYQSFNDPWSDFNSNMIFIYAVLNALRRYSAHTKFIFLSSAAVYGNPLRLPVTETDPLNPISPYGFHKLQAELVAREFYDCFGIISIVLRIFSCYGIGQRKLFLWDLCVKALAQKKVLLKGCGNESRDFIHVIDVAVCMDHLIEQNVDGFEVFNLASGKEYSIRDTATLLIDKLGSNNEIFFEGTKNTGNPDNWAADISKLTKLGYQPSISFESGIEAYANWFKSLEHVQE